MRTVVRICYMRYVCVELYVYVTHGNVNLLHLRTTVRICKTWTIYVKLSYDMYVPHTYVTPVNSSILERYHHDGGPSHIHAVANNP